jgi:hypothetical protein
MRRWRGFGLVILAAIGGVLVSYNCCLDTDRPVSVLVLSSELAYPLTISLYWLDSPEVVVLTDTLLQPRETRRFEIALPDSGHHIAMLVASSAGTNRDLPLARCIRLITLPALTGGAESSGEFILENALCVSITQDEMVSIPDANVGNTAEFRETREGLLRGALEALP